MVLCTDFEEIPSRSQVLMIGLYTRNFPPVASAAPWFRNAVDLSRRAATVVHITAETYLECRSLDWTG